MAVGSNSLALLFKIGVDAGDAQKEITSLTTAFKEGLGKGALQGVKDFEKQTSGAFERVGQSLQQTRSGLENLFRGDVLEGTTQLVRQFGVLAVGLGAVAVAGLAVKKSIEGILDVAEQIGTDSVEDFEELQKSMARVGETITLVDHGLSQELLKSAKDVKTAFDAMFVEMLRVEGPALILLFNEVVKIIRDVLTPAADSFAARQVEGIVQFIGLVRGLQAIHNLPTGIMGTDFREWAGIVQGYVKQTRTELESLQTKLKGTTGDFAPAKSPHVAALKKQIDEFQKALDAAQKDYDAFRKKLDDTLIKSMEDLSKGVNQQVLDHQKFLASLKQQWLDYADFIHKQTDDIVKDLARQAQPVPGGAGTGPIPGAPPEIPLPKPAVGGFFEDLHNSLGQSINEFQTWGDIVGGILAQFAQAAEQAFAAFILTGKFGGQIFKQLVAQIIASLAIESAVKAIFQLAEGFASLAAGDYRGAALHFTSAKIYGAVAIAAGVAGAIIGARGGLGGDTAGEAAGAGGFGGTAAPGTLTINQGAGGGQLGVLLSIDNHLSNLTTATPGDVVTRGSEQNPVAIGQANNEASRRDGSISREFLQISGLRTA